MAYLSGFPLVLWGIVCLGIAAAIVAVGYQAYDARRARERARIADRASRGDPVEDLEAVNDKLADQLDRARRSLEETRDAVRDGVRW